MKRECARCGEEDVPKSNIIMNCVSGTTTERIFSLKGYTIFFIVRNSSHEHKRERDDIESTMKDDKQTHHHL